MVKQFIQTPDAPKPAGPYSPGIKVGNFVFVSGQMAKDPKVQKIVATDIEEQTRQTLDNVKAILEAAGSSMRDVVRVSVFLKNVDDFQKMNEIYKTFFPENLPTRTTVEAKLVRSNALIEVDVIAYHE